MIRPPWQTADSWSSYCHCVLLSALAVTRHSSLIHLWLDWWGKTSSFCIRFSFLWMVKAAVGVTVPSLDFFFLFFFLLDFDLELLTFTGKCVLSVRRWHVIKKNCKDTASRVFLGSRKDSITAESCTSERQTLSAFQGSDRKKKHLHFPFSVPQSQFNKLCPAQRQR